MAPTRLALLFAFALPTAAAATTGCEDRQKRDDASSAENDASERTRIAPPRVPEAPAPAGTEGSEAEARDLDRDCLRSAAGIAGWRAYLARWSAGAYRGVSLPSVESTESTELRPVRPPPDAPTVLIGPTGVSVGATSVYERPSPGEPWSDSELDAATEALRDADLSPDDRPSKGDRTPVPTPFLIAADRSLPAKYVSQVARTLAESGPAGESGSRTKLPIVVRDSSVPPPVANPRPKIAWVEEMIATFRRADRPDTRQQLLDDAVARTIGRCRRLRPVVDRVYEKDEELADRRAERAPDTSLIETAGACECGEIDWKALESLLVWHLEPLTDAAAVYVADHGRLPTSGDETIEAFVRESLE